LAAAGLPLFMVAGFSWPSEAIPPVIRLVSYLVPSTSAIDGFVKLSQLGAPLATVNSEFLTLSALVFFYNLVALLLMVLEGRAPGSASCRIFAGSPRGRGRRGAVQAGRDLSSCHA
jgi:ABC-2 type transport system permease protein